MLIRIFVMAVCCGLAASAWAQDQEQPKFDRYTYNIGGGFGLGRSYEAAFSGNTGFAVAGFGRNLTRLFSVDAEYMYYDLGLRRSVELNQGVPDASGRFDVYSLDGIMKAPYHFHKVGIYGITGVGFYRRTMSTPATTLVAGAPCQHVFDRWFGIACNDASGYNVVTPTQTLSSYSKIAGGFNFGFGLTYPLGYLHNAKFYVEFRDHRAYQSDAQASMWPIAIGFRW